MVVVTWRGRGLVGSCLDALAAQTRAHRVLVVDNGSTDGTGDMLAAHPTRPRVLRLRRNAGYAGALAAALPRVGTPFTAWINDDAEPAPGWLAALEGALDVDATVAAASSALHDGSAITSLGVALTPIGYGVDTTACHPFGFCGGAALLRTGMLRAAGGVPAAFFCYYEDTDTSWRLRLAGHRVVAVPAARVRHASGASSGHDTAAFHRWNERNRLLMLLRCAPAGVVARELGRFAALTLVLPWRRNRPGAANFALALRVRVLAEVASRLPATLIARHRIGRRATVARSVVWSTWAGHGGQPAAMPSGPTPSGPEHRDRCGDQLGTE